MGVHESSTKYLCHACNIDVENIYRNSTQMMQAFYEYESVVEYIESLPRGAVFKRTEVWKALGKGYSLWTYVTYATRDMALHGLIECVHRTKDGRCCLKYKVKNE